jgi:hypothetical protein
MATIQLRRHLTGVAVAPPASANPGEPFFSIPGFTGGGPNSLWIDDGAALVPLVDNTRQVELAGAQTITGVKTIDIADLSILGGAANDVLQTDGAGVLTWGAVAAGGLLAVEHDATMTGDGTAATPLSVVTATPVLLGVVNVPAGSALALTAGALSMEVATAAEIATGTDDVYPITSLGLRGEMGAPASTLVTTATTVVPAINELAALITGSLNFAGSYDVVADAVDPIGAAAPGPLPAPTAAVNGRYVICVNDGPGLGEAAAAGPYVAEDWIICGEDPAAAGTYVWHKLSVGGAAVTAANVAITAIPPLVATDVQGALEEIVAAVSAGIVTDASLTGSGTTAAPLAVELVDGGTF